MKNETRYELTHTGCVTAAVCSGDVLERVGPRPPGPGTLFASGLAAVVMGLLLPVPAFIVDILLAFSVSLAVAVVLIAFSARRIAQVQGFPLLVVVAAALQLGLAVCCSKLILLTGYAGTVAAAVGRVITADHYRWSVVLFVPAAVIALAVIFRAVVFVGRFGSAFAAELARRCGDDEPAWFDIDSLDDGQVCSLQTKMAQAADFYAAMATSCRFVLGAVLVESPVIILTVIAAMAASSAASAHGPAGPAAYLQPALGAGALFQVCSLLTVLAARSLVRNNSLIGDPRWSPGTAAHRVEVQSTPVDASGGRGDDPAEENPAGADSATAREFSAGFVNIDESPRCDNPPAPDRSRAVNSQPCSTARHTQPGNPPAGRYHLNKADYYKALADLLESRTAAPAVVVMAAGRVGELPVTVPVNIAMLLAKKHRRCLLVDLDRQRNAIARVFSLEPTAAGSETGICELGTCIENLYIVPANRLPQADSHGDDGPLRQFISSATRRYDYVIAYAPSPEAISQCRHLADCNTAALVFGDDCLRTTLAEAGCRILEPTHDFAQPGF